MARVAGKSPRVSKGCHRILRTPEPIESYGRTSWCVVRTAHIWRSVTDEYAPVVLHALFVAGFFGENGPFLARPGNPQTELVLNGGRWNRGTNLLVRGVRPPCLIQSYSVLCRGALQLPCSV